MTNKALDTAFKAAKEASQIIVSALDKPRAYSHKGISDLVTQTDKLSESRIIELIQNTFPDHGILAEESGSNKAASQSRYQWIIDPLDGTTNFVHGYPSFGVSIALFMDNSPLLGVIIELPGNNVYHAVKGEGAYRNNSPISVSKNQELSHSLVVTGFGYEHGEKWHRNMELFKQLTHRTQGVRRLGAASVDLCHVSCGIVDGFWEYDLHPWDTAAGILLVEEAGGKISGIDGKPYSIYQDHILATNSAIHDSLMDILNTN